MVHLSADKWSAAECIRADKWFPEFPVLCEFPRVMRTKGCVVFVFAYQYLSQESSSS